MEKEGLGLGATERFIYSFLGHQPPICVRRELHLRARSHKHGNPKKKTGGSLMAPHWLDRAQAWVVLQIAPRPRQPYFFRDTQRPPGFWGERKLGNLASASMPATQNTKRRQKKTNESTENTCHVIKCLWDRQTVFASVSVAESSINTPPEVSCCASCSARRPMECLSICQLILRTP